MRRSAGPWSVTPELATERLHSAGHLHTGRVLAMDLKELEAKRGAVTTAAELSYSPDAEGDPPRKLVVKQSDDFLFWSGYLEALFYSQLVSETPDLSTPRCYDAYLDRESKTYVLLLHDLTDTHSLLGSPSGAVPLAPKHLEQIVDQLAYFHAYWWEHPRIEDADFDVPVRGPVRLAQALPAHAIRRMCASRLAHDVPTVAAELGSRTPAGWREFIAESLGRWAALWITRTGDGKALTLIHGDCGYWNWMAPKGPALGCPVVIDWGCCARGLGVYDLAYLILQSDLPYAAQREVERPLLERYHSQLTGHGVQSYAWSQFVHDYQLAIIANLLIPFVWRDVSGFETTMHAFHAWDCAELLTGVA